MNTPTPAPDWRVETDARKAAIASLLSELAITQLVRFVPWSKSRSYDRTIAHPKDKSLNWLITVQRDGRDLLTINYTAGIGHCPSYRQFERWTLDYTSVIDYEVEHGKAGKIPSWGYDAVARRPSDPTIAPDLIDVVYSLIMDADAIEYPVFEHWADTYGYDHDSRKAETVYRECLRVGLALRAELGEANLARLRTAYEGY